MADSLSGAPQQALAVLFAIAGAACYAAASVVQQRSAAQLASSKAFDPVVLVRLVRARRWLLGLIGIAGGFGFHGLRGGDLDVLQAHTTRGARIGLPLCWSWPRP